MSRIGIRCDDNEAELKFISEQRERARIGVKPRGEDGIEMPVAPDRAEAFAQTARVPTMVPPTANPRQARHGLENGSQVYVGRAWMPVAPAPQEHRSHGENADFPAISQGVQDV